MAEKYSFFNAIINDGVPDRSYTAEDYAKYFGSFLSNGIFPNPSTNLEVKSNGDMTVTLKEGKAWINGYFYHNTDDLVLSLDVADSILKRIDRVVIRLDFINREIRTYIKKGTLASNPTAPSLKRDTDVYELGIADILVSNGIINIAQTSITDTRMNSELCGMVNSLIKVDSSILTDRLEEDFNIWFETIKDILDGDIAANLANRLATIESEKLVVSKVKPSNQVKDRPWIQIL